jgi:hypothetical protein
MIHIRIFEGFSSGEENQLKTAMESAMRNPSDSKPILVSSSPGVGATAMIGEIANNIGIQMLHIDCAISNMNDFEDFLPFDRNGFIVFDDVNRAPSQFLSYAMKMATTRQYKEYTLPDGWVIVLVTKSVDGDSSMGSAIRDKFTYVDLGLM